MLCAHMPRSGAVTLSDLREPRLTLTCEPCGRRGIYSVERLYDKHGDAHLPDLLNLLSAACPKRMANSMTDRCKAGFCWAHGPPTPREDRDCIMR
jgi:hypothetical protein